MTADVGAIDAGSTRRQEARAAQRAHIPESVALSGFAAFRVSLMRSRERGVPFARAWKTAMRTTHPNGRIYVALVSTKPEWRAAYEREPPTPREVAVARLGAWLDDPLGA